jgi:hypothetical protein
MARFVDADDLRLKVGKGWELVDEDMEHGDLSYAYLMF